MDEYSEPDPEFTCDASFKDLGIQKDMIVDYLLDHGVLPSDFHKKVYAN